MSNASTLDYIDKYIFFGAVSILSKNAGVDCCNSCNLVVLTDSIVSQLNNFIKYMIKVINLVEFKLIQYTMYLYIS